MRLRRRATLRRALLALLVMGAALTACSGTGSLSTPSDPAQPLIGAWALVSGCGGIAFHCVDAQQLQEPSRYVFSRDGFVTAFRGGTQLFRASYTITPGSTDGTGDERPLLTIGGSPTTDPRPLRLRFATSDTVYLDEGCCDRFTFQYRRLP